MKIDLTLLTLFCCWLVDGLMEQGDKVHLAE
jgi:hypothetical protein